MKQVLDNMLSVVSEIAVERKATLVLPKDAVLLVDKSLDVSQETLQKVDQKLPTVPVKIVAPPAPGHNPAQAAATTTPAKKSTAKKKEKE
jgi:hypothetical protein